MTVISMERPHGEALGGAGGAAGARARARAGAQGACARCEECGAARRRRSRTYLRTGLTRVCQPARYGGYELGWDVLCEISQVLAAACGSQAWIQRIFADHSQMLSTFPAQAQEDVWGKDHSVCIAASFDPTGRARPVEGGATVFRSPRLFERHRLRRLDDLRRLYRGERPARRSALLAGAEVRRDGARRLAHVGLEGTGSKTFVVADTFVPGHRFLDGRLARAGQGPGTAINKAPLYRLPKGGGLTSTGFAALAVGMAKGVLEEWLAYTGPRKSRGVSIGAMQSSQMVAALSAGEIDAAEALYLGSIRAAMRKLGEGETISAIEMVTAKRNVAYACQLVLTAATRLFNNAGGRALFRTSAMQRQYRNLLGAVSHHGVVWDQAASEYGAALLEQYGAPRADESDVD